MRGFKTLVTVLILSLACSIAVGQNIVNKGPHEIRLGVGAVIVPGYYNNNIKDDIPPPGSAPGYYRYPGDKIGTPGINFSYTYQLKRWLALGITLGYAGVFQKSYDLYTDNTVSKKGKHFISFTPAVRFDWYRSNMVKLYSCFGLGLGHIFERERYIGQDYVERDGFYTPTIDFTPLGISVGRKIFGFCEFGLSTQGFVKAGIGYRFNDRTKK